MSIDSELPSGDGVARPRPEQTASESTRSQVSIWRPAGAKGRRWSIRVVAGTSQSELEELVELALEAERRIERPRKEGATWRGSG